MTVFSDTNLLNPKFARACVRLHKYLIFSYKAGRTKTRFEIFETYRTPQRQNDVLRKGTSTVAAFNSAHQFGLACDFVPYLTAEEAKALTEITGEHVFPGWNWHASHDYRFLATAAEFHKLTVPIKWDPCHVEHPLWREFSKKHVSVFS